MTYPVFTCYLNATNAGLLRDFSHKWYNVFSDRKKNSIRFYTPKEIKRISEKRYKSLLLLAQYV